MKTFTATPVATQALRSRREIAGRIGMWTVSVLLSAQFAAGGVLKLSGDPAMVSMFDDVGAGQWLRMLIGGCEVAGAIGLLFHRWARSAGAGLVLLMIGATVTNVVVLAISPAPPLIFGVLAAAVLALRAREEAGR